MICLAYTVSENGVKCLSVISKAQDEVCKCRLLSTTRRYLVGSKKLLKWFCSFLFKILCSASIQDCGAVTVLCYCVVKYWALPLRRWRDLILTVRGEKREVRKQKYYTVEKVGFSQLHVTAKSVTLQRCQEQTGKPKLVVQIMDNLA